MSRRSSGLKLAVVVAVGTAAMVGCGELIPEGFGPGECARSFAPPGVDPWTPEAETFENRVVELTNQRRLEGGCCGSQGCFPASRALTVDESLRAAARLHARDMAAQGYFAHESLDGRAVVDRVRQAGFGGCAVGENIARGQRTPEEVMAGWMESDGHCANILLGDYRRLGVAYVDEATSEFRRLWVQNFGD